MEELTKKYYENINAFSLLMKECLVDDSAKEIIDFKATHERTKKFVGSHPEILRNERRVVIAWLNSVWYQLDTVSVEWLFEMSYRIRKIIAITVTLERLNLESFGGKPEKCDIPQSIVHIYNRLMTLEEKTFPMMRKMFVELVNKYDEFKNYYE